MRRFALGSLIAVALGAASPSFAEEMGAQVMPFFFSGQAGMIQGEKKIRLGYRKWERDDERGAIVLIPGRGDPFQIYAETIYDFAQAGYSVYALDHRGQGSSDRILKTDRQLGYVEEFKYYARDLQAFLDQVVNSRDHRKRFLVAHSMGGAVAAYHLLKYPGAFTGVALVAPMLKINTSPYGYKEAHVIAVLLQAAMRGKKFAPNRGPFDPTETFSLENYMTTSPVRWQYFFDTFAQNPELQTGGATVHWVWEALRADDWIHKHADEIGTPILMLSAGDDKIVVNDEQDYFCKTVRRCTPVPVYPTSKHLILHEIDAIREDALKRIFEFFDAQE